MFHRAVALVGLFALSPAHATLIEHSFTSTGTHFGGDVHEGFGAGVDDTIAGEFLFGDAARRAHYPHLWRVQMRGDHQQARGDKGYLAEWVEFCLGERFIGPVTHSGLQVPDAFEWRYGTLNRWFAGGAGAHARTPESVPEPATLSLLGAGVLGALVARRRRRIADA